MSTPLPNSFSFFFSFFKKSLNSQTNIEVSYEDNIKLISSFSTIEDFWKNWQHMIKPEQLPSGCEFFLFQQGIKPMWEDKGNEGGGRFIIRLKKEVSNRLWEDIMLAFIGESITITSKICGLVLTVKEREIVISVWIAALDIDERAAIKKFILSSLQPDLKTPIEYRDHPREEKTEEKKGEV